MFPFIASFLRGKHLKLRLMHNYWGESQKRKKNWIKEDERNWGGGESTKIMPILTFNSTKINNWSYGQSSQEMIQMKYGHCSGQHSSWLSFPVLQSFSVETNCITFISVAFIAVHLQYSTPWSSTSVEQWMRTWIVFFKFQTCIPSGHESQTFYILQRHK